jgi:hypothetical protein
MVLLVEGLFDERATGNRSDASRVVRDRLSDILKSDGDYMTRNEHDPWWISLNVTRTRLTLLGFNLSVIAFLTGTMLTIHEERAFTQQLAVMTALYLSFALSFISAACLLASQELDREGLSRPWLFSVGDVIMYVALSQSLAAMMRTSLRAVDRATEAVQLAHGTPWVGETVVVATSGLALIAWASLFYVGPLLSIRRSPVRSGSRWRLGLIYGGLVLLTMVLAVDAHVVQDVALDEPEPLWRIFLWQFVQPLVW